MSGSVSFVVFFTVLLFLGSFFEKIFRERTFVFVCRCWSGVFWCCFAYVFALLFVFFALETVLKNSIDVRSGVFGLSFLFLWFFVDVVVLVFFLFLFF